MSNPASPTSGVKPMAIAGRMVRERERLFGMSKDERAWRAQWLKDQVLAPDEPILPKDFYVHRYNPIRRFYRAPLDKLEAALTKPLGEVSANVIRNFIGKSTIGFFLICGIFYHFKYNANDWTKKTGIKVCVSRPTLYPEDAGYPNYKRLADDEYASYGFKNSPI